MDEIERKVRCIRNMITGVKCKNEEMLRFLLDRSCLKLLEEGSDIYRNEINACFLINSIIAEKKWEYSKEVFERLENIGIPYCVFKGEILSMMAYGMTKYRNSSDIDIIISSKNYAVIKEILGECGFFQGYINNGSIYKYKREEIVYYEHFTHQTAPFIKQLTGEKLLPVVSIDVNFSVLWDDVKQDICTTEFIKDRKFFCVLEDLHIHKLDYEHELIAILLHFYKDINSIFIIYEKGIRLDSVLDLGYYLERNADHLQVDNFINECIKFKVVDYIYVAVRYVEIFFESEIVDRIITDLKNEISANLLDLVGLPTEGIRSWNMPLKERVLDASFHEHFLKMLTTEDIKKIELNRKMQH